MENSINFFVEEIFEHDELYLVMNQRILFIKNNVNDFLLTNQKNEQITINTNGNGNGNENMNTNQNISIYSKYGPPDICYLVKEIKPKGIFGLSSKKMIKFGAYHYVYGMDTSNIAFISAYINNYIQKQVVLYKEGVNKEGYRDLKVTQTIFCAYDIFIQKDLRILIKFPGGIKKIFYIDEQSSEEIEVEGLRTVLLSGFIRGFNLEEVNYYSIYLEDMSTHQMYEYITESIIMLINENAEYKYPNLKHKLKITLETYISYMIKTRRFNQAIINFSRMTMLNNIYVKYVIQPLNKLELYEDALNYLASVLLYNPNNFSLLNMEIDLLIKLNKLEDALEIGKYISSLNPESAENWISLGKVYLKMKVYDKVFRSLNNIYFLKNQVAEVETTKNILFFKEISISKNSNVVSMIQSKGSKPTSLLLNNDSSNTNMISIYYNDILIKPKTIDIIHPLNQVTYCDNAETIIEIINKIMNCSYFTFTNSQRDAYLIVLNMIKDVNFDDFLDMKRKLFFLNEPIYLFNNQNQNQTKNQNEEMEKSTFRSELLGSISNENKININPVFDMILYNLVEDIKLFSLVITKEEEYLNKLFKKDNLSLIEIKFCVSIGILSERLLYYNTALKFYSKALVYCFSVFINYRKIKIYKKLRDFKSLLLQLVHLLSFINPDNLTKSNKSPIWIDEIMLLMLSEINASEMFSWITEAPKYVIDYLNKRIIMKYQFWINEGHDIHIIKE